MNCDDDLRPFVDLMQHHPVMRPPLFRYLAERAAASTLTGRDYRLLATNVVAKTGFTLPRILKAAKEGALDLEPTVTAFTAMTALEEAGGGKPEGVHMHLMMRALNYHGEVAYGLDPVDYRELQELQRLLDDVGRLLRFKVATDGIAAEAAREIELVSGLDGLAAETLALAVRHGFAEGAKPGLDGADLADIWAGAGQALAEKGVLPEVVAYGQQELYAQRTCRPGYIQGVTFVGEAVADDMLLSLFAVMYNDIHKYQDPVGRNDLPADFERQVLPYFAAHGEYLAILRGQETVDARKTEIIHAERELLKLSQLDPEQLVEAFRGARDFADRNLKVWNGILARLLAEDPELPGAAAATAGTDMPELLHSLELDGAFLDGAFLDGVFDGGGRRVVDIVAAALRG